MRVVDHAGHSRFSDPARHGALLYAVEPSVEAVSEVARNVVVH